MKSTQQLNKEDQIQPKLEPQFIENTKMQNQKNQNTETEKKNQKILNFFHLYKYADRIDYLLILLGIILSIATGCGLPFFAVVAGNMVNAFEQINNQMIQKTATARNQFLYIGFGTFSAAFLSVVTWMKIGQRVSDKCRQLYFKKILKCKNSNLFKNKKSLQEMESNFLIFKQALGYKVGCFVFIAASLVAGGRNAISTGWLLSLIMVSTLPLLGISGVLYTFFVQLKQKQMQKCYLKAQQRSEKVIRNLKEIKMLNGEMHEFLVYDKLCTFLKRKVILFSSLVGVGAGWFSLVQFGVYALAFWFGSHCVEGTYPCEVHDSNDRYTPGGVIVIFFAFYVRLDSMQQILPTLRKIYQGMKASQKIYEIIENDEDYEVEIEVNQILTAFNKQVELNNVQISQMGKGQNFKNISYIGSQSGLFDTSLSNNITYGFQTQNEGIINKLMRQFQIQKSIDLLKSTQKIGYEGRSLEYLQRRKLLIIRTLLKKSKVIVIQQLLRPGMEVQQYQLFNKLIQLSNNTLNFIYLGYNPHIIQLLSRQNPTKNGKIIQYDFHQQLKIANQKQRIGINHQNHQNVLYFTKSYSQLPKYSPQSIELIQEQKILQNHNNKILSTLFPFIKQYKTLICIGLFFSFLCGLLYPIFTIFLADILLETFKFKNQPQQTSFIRQNIQRPVLVIVYIGISSFVFNFIENFIFSVFNEKLKHQFRTQSYQKLLNLPMKWFSQNSSHKPQKIIERLKQNSSHTSLILTSFLPIIFKNLVSTIAGLTIAFIFQWRSALLGLITLPMMMASGFLLMNFFNEHDSKTEKMYKESSEIITQTANNIKTVRIEGYFNLVQHLYTEKIRECEHSTFMRSLVVGLKFGLSQLLIFLSFAIMFDIGSVFLRGNQSMTVLSLFTAIFAVIWPGWTSGSNFFRTPNWEKCKNGVSYYLQLMDSQEERDADGRSQDQRKVENKMQQQKIVTNVELKQREIQSNQLQHIWVERSLELRDVKIKEEEVWSINELILSLKGPQKIGHIVGDISMLRNVVELILRLQQSGVEGNVFIDGKNINRFNLKQLRKNIIKVTDTPLIFQNTTIKQNIIYNFLYQTANSQQQQNDIQRQNLYQQVQQLWNEINFYQQTQVLQSENTPTYTLQSILLPQQKIPNSIKVKISLVRALLRKPQIIFLTFSHHQQSEKNNLQIEFWKKFLSTNNYGLKIKKVLILRQNTDNLPISTKNLVIIKQKKS